MDKIHASYTIVEPVRKCKIFITSEESGLLRKIWVVYHGLNQYHPLNPGGQSLNEEHVRLIYIMFGEDKAERFKDVNLFAPFLFGDCTFKRAEVEIDREHLWTIGQVVRIVIGKIGDFHLYSLDNDKICMKTYELRGKINRSIEEYDNHGK